MGENMTGGSSRRWVMVENTLKDILRQLQDYGTILRHIDNRIDAMESSIELVRQNQNSINRREAEIERSFQEREQKVDEVLQKMNKRISSIESKETPIPYPLDDSCSEEV